MIKSEYKVIGVMSGTSLDGIDLALVTFNYNKNWSFKIGKAETIPYPESWMSLLKELVDHTKRRITKFRLQITLYI